MFDFESKHRAFFRLIRYFSCFYLVVGRVRTGKLK